MKIAVIICEYNPLQKGHVYHIQNTLKNCMCDRLVCVMSGNFVQRGEYAVENKYVRAEWAVKNGADCVIELPPEYVLSTAKYFALGAVKLADLIDGEVTLSFGSEDGNLENLKKAVEFEEDGNFKNLLDGYLKKGYGYAQSYSLAIKEYSPVLADILSTPNNILGIEYLKAIKALNSQIVPYTLKRLGDYRSLDANTETNSSFASASAIRQLLQKGDHESVRNAVPDDVYACLKNISSESLEKAKDKLFAILRYTMDTKKAASAHGVKEGIENRISECIKTSRNYDELLSNLATKRYTNAYLMRTLLNIVLQNDYTAQQLANKDIEFVNVLAVAEDSKDVLSLFKNKVITRASALAKDCLISKCDNLYSSLFPETKDNAMRVVKR